MQMALLRCKTAAMVRKEVAVHRLAGNSVRKVNVQAAQLAGGLPQRMSFKTAQRPLQDRVGASGSGAIGWRR